MTSVQEFFQMINQTEKRLFKRIDTSLEVEVMGFGPLKGIASNISCGGLFLETDPHQVYQENLSLLIYLPHRKNPVQLVAQVLRRENEKRRGVAFQFSGLYDDNILAIEQFVKSKVH